MTEPTARHEPDPTEGADEGAHALCCDDCKAAQAKLAEAEKERDEWMAQHQALALEDFR